MARLRLARTLGVSPKRLEGWEPRQVQRGYDATGTPVRVVDAVEVVVETEPEWDDLQRGLLLGLAEYEKGLCECGWHESLTADKTNHFTYETRTCPVCGGGERFTRILADRDEKKRGEKPAPGRVDPADGRRVLSRLMTPTEVAAAEAKKRRKG